jgi:hypothetical protein
MTTLAMQNLTASDGTTPQFGLGDEYQVNGNRYKYLKAEGALAAYALCYYDAALDAREATTTLVGTPARPTGFCIPQFAVADEEYFWAPIGPFYLNKDGTTFKVLAANAATSVRLYTTGTAGVADDAVTTGLVAGLFLTETVTTQEAADCMAVQRLVSFCEL